MSLRLIQPGRSAATRHPKTGELVTPIGYTKAGKAIWPVMGASSDDPDDPEYTRTDDDDPDDDDDPEDDPEDDEDEKDKKKSKAKHAKDDEDDEEDDDDKPRYSQREMDRIKNRMRAADKRSSDYEERLRKLEDKGKKPEEVKEREERQRERESERREAELRETRFENAFFRASDIDWVDKDDAFAAALRAGILDDVTDEDGTIDRKALARSLRDLAKRKPHLVKARRTQRVPADGKDDEDQRSVTTPTLNGKRRGQRETSSRDALSKRFPALGRPR